MPGLAHAYMLAPARLCPSPCIVVVVVVVVVGLAAVGFWFALRALILACAPAPPYFNVGTLIVVVDTPLQVARAARLGMPLLVAHGALAHGLGTRAAAAVGGWRCRSHRPPRPLWRRPVIRSSSRRRPLAASATPIPTATTTTTVAGGAARRKVARLAAPVASTTSTCTCAAAPRWRATKACSTATQRPTTAIPAATATAAGGMPTATIPTTAADATAACGRRCVAGGVQRANPHKHAAVVWRAFGASGWARPKLGARLLGCGARCAQGGLHAMHGAWRRSHRARPR